jgi:lipopolysaccharide transport system ATP-binding protein
MQQRGSALEADRVRGVTELGRPRLRMLRGTSPEANPRLSVDGLTLAYPVGGGRQSSIKAGLMRLLGYREPGAEVRYVRALNNISFDVNRGDRIAIIGHNGAGKSTLLRALAGIYPPTSGSVAAAGEIGTLLNISLGFETEATGRENIYHRGFAMGLSRKELREAEADIVEFAGLNDFIDLPMRTYSSGMYVRLGFAISTQFAPDILLIDEVFGAGDASFAAKARQRMEDIVSGSGIVVMVSHDLGSVQSFCNRVIWLSGGEVFMDGRPQEVVQAYLAAMNPAS